MFVNTNIKSADSMTSEQIIKDYGCIPYNNPNFFKVLTYNKSYIFKISMWLRREYIPVAMLQDKV